MRCMLVLAGMALLAGGCDGPRNAPNLAEVTGVVTYDGAPLADAEVMFFPDSAKRSQGRTDAFGRYELMYRGDVKGAVVGRHTVVISKTVTDQQMVPHETLPDRYSGNSEMRRDVHEGANIIDFELHSDPAADETSSD